ncbi:MAG: amidohydrolase family protein, partial [Actinomycetota bacterium]
MTVTRLTGGEVLDRAGRRRSDVVVDDEAGTIVAVGTDLADGANGDTATLDATGAVVCPGFVDLHVHLRQPGFEAAGTIESGARSAALGGFTALVAAADTDPCPDDAVVIAEVLALAKSALCEVIPAAALTLGRGGEAMARYQGLVDAGVRFFSDADTPVADARVIRNALDYLVSLGQTAGVTLVAGQRLRHPLDEGGLVNEGEWSARLGLAGRPAVAEELAVGREIALARLTGASIHLQQVSTAGAVA